MNLFSFSRLFAKLGQRREERKAKKHRGPRPITKLFLEPLEDRTLLSSTPAAVVTNPNAAFAAGFDPQVVMDPVNSQFLVEVDTTGTALAGQVSTNGGQTWKAFTISVNVGDPTTFDSTINFGEDAYPDVTSPSVAFDRNGNFYIVSNQYNAAAQTLATNGTDLANGSNVAGASGAIVFDKFSFNNGSPTEIAADSNQILYQWYGQNPAYNPTVAVDANLPATTTGGPSFTDPTTGATQTDTLAVSINPTTGAVVAPGTSGAAPKGIYVGWNINFTEPSGSSPASVSRIMIAASGDGGAHFTTNQYADTVGTDIGTAPQILFTQGTNSNNVNTVPGGQMNIVYGDGTTFINGVATGDSDAVIQQNQPDGGTVGNLVAATGIASSTGSTPIFSGVANPATNPNPIYFSSTTTATATVAASDFDYGGGAAFGKIDDLDVTVDIQFPDMQTLQIELIPPTGSGLATITLVANGVDDNGNGTGIGLPNEANLGVLTDVVNGETFINNVGTVFDDQAPRSIVDGSATTPWIGDFKPESGSLGEVDGLTPAQVAGKWTLQVVDETNNGSNDVLEGFITGFSLHFSSLISTSGFGANADTGTDNPSYSTTNDHSRTVSLVTTRKINGVTTVVSPGALGGSPSNVYSTNESTSGTTAGGSPGTGPGIVAAIDNTLGALSPYEGRLYIAYVGLADVGAPATDTGIFLVHSDNDGGNWNDTTQNPPIQVNDDTAADNFSEGDRPEFMPSIAVDPITGTVVIDYYDGRYDASELRVANSISYSVDGGADFSTSVTMNQETTATDAITGDTVDVAPIPGNQGQAGALGFGDRQGLVVYDGDVVPLFSSNLNSGGVEIMTADVTIPSGPTVVSGDMGPVVSDFTYQPTIYDSQYSNYTGPGATYAPITYNNVFATAADAPYPVGTRGLSSFVISFDRPVDISTFTTSQIQVMYESATGATSPVAVASITPLDNLTQFGPDLVGLGLLATQFLITLVAPQFAVGTYSYAVGLPASTPDGALVSDDIRSVPTGIADDAGPTGTATVSGSSETILLGTSQNTVFAVPNPVLGTPFQAPYNSTTLPLIIPGPHVVSTAVVSAGTYNTTTTYSTSDVVLQGDQQNLSDQNNIDISGTLDDIALSLAPGASTTTGQLLLPITDAFQIQQDATDQIQVNLNLANAAGDDLEIQLVAQDGNSVTLLNGTVASNTLAFNDYAPTGTVAPVTPLSALVNDDTAGDWQLVITNKGSSTAALTVEDWSLQLPHTTSDNEALNSTATGILVTFDRNMMMTGANTLTAAAVLQMIGPLGAITGPFTIINGHTLYSEGLIPLALENRVFEITFPTQSLNGTYTLSIAPSVEDTNGNAVDTNLNAGLDVLEGTNPTNTVVVSTTYPNTQAVTLPPTSTVTSTISISDAFTIAQPTDTWTLTSPLTTASTQLTVGADTPTPPPGQFTVTIDNEQLVIAANTTGTTWNIVQRGVDGTTPASHNAGADVIYTGNQIQLQLDITPPSGSTLKASDLQAQLISPIGTVIQLFTNVGQGDGGVQEFNFTTFDDFATTPIQNATPPFASTYNPQQPLSVLDGQSTAGTWQLVLTNTSTTSTDIGTLDSWSLTFPHVTPDTGLGQGVGTGDADQISASFRIFNEDPTSAAGSEQWTAVGPAADNNSTNTGPVNAIAVDPSDPSGNTVYVASASGGLWKTTDFLTTNPAGPTYVPLINLAPTGGLNISSIAVFGRNNDPAQSVIYALTGNPNNVTIPGNIGDSNDNAAGVGLLRSEDGGQTWQVLDSLTNVYTSSNGGTATLGQPNTDGNSLPEMDPTGTPTAPRNYQFVGLVGYQVTVDPTPLNGQIVVYAAFSNGISITTGAANNNGGLYRSEDGGNTWTLIQSGNATSVVLAAGSGDAYNDSNRNLEVLYAAFTGTGVLYTQNATGVGTGGLTQFNNQPQYPGRYVATLDNGFATISNTPIPTSASGNPNGAYGRIVLATPALTSSPVENLFYQGWVYAAVANAAGTALQGLYVSKDYSGTWTQIQLPEYVTQPGLFTEVFGTNNSNNGDINPLIDNPTFGALNLTLAVDPTDPEIVYLGGGGSNLLRIDISNLSDPYAMVGYNNIAPGASGATSVQTSTTGPASVTSAPYGELNTSNNTLEKGPNGNTNFYDLYHNALNPFLSSGAAATPYLVGINPFNNQGTGALMGEIGNLTNDQGVSILSSSLDMRALVAIVDPLTGETRLLVGDDMGIYTGTDQSVTAIQSNVGAAVEVTGSRNGNLQLADMADSAAQPSSEAATLAGALLYGDSQFDNGFPQSTSNVLDTGNLNWTGVTPDSYSEINSLPVQAYAGDGEFFATDQTGTGQVFQDRWGSTQAINQYPYNDANFFLETPPGGTPQSFVSGISNLSDQGAEFPFQGGSRFAVNAVNPDDLLISSQTGEIYLSTNEGNQWLPTNFTTDTGGSYANALAFGASNSAYSFQDTDASFLYAGTTSGNIYVSLTGGTNWYQTTGLAGAGAIEQIVADPTQGSYNAFAVTENGVYYLSNVAFNTSTGIVTSAVWTPITGNLFSQTRPLFNNPNNPYPTLFAGGLTSIAVDWRFAVPTSNTAYASNTWTLASALSATTATATTLTVNAGGPTPPTTPFFITIGQEVLEVTATNSTTNVWTILRAQDGTTEAAHAANAPVTTSGTAPVLYVGGDGGVFRSEDGGTTWTNFPNVTDTWTLVSALTATATTLTVKAGGPAAPTSPFTITIDGEELEVTAVNSTTNVWTILRAQDGTTAAMHTPATNDIANNGDNAVQQGGLLPDMQVTSLQLVNGDLNTSTGLPNESTGGYNILVASTYGQGDFAIHLDNSAVLNDVVPQISLAGPQVVSVVAATTNGGKTLTGITITFNHPVDPQTLLPADIKVYDPNGALLAVQSVTEISPTEYQVVFQHSDSTIGIYSVNVSGATDEAGDVMTPYTGHLTIPYVNSEAVFDFPITGPGSGIYVYGPGAGFQQLLTTNASILAIDSAGDVAAELPGYGVYRYTAATETWTLLTKATASLLAIDGGGNVYADLSGSGMSGIYELSSPTSSKLLTSANATLLAVDAAGDLVADFKGYGLQELLAGHTTFTQLYKADASLLTMDAAGDLFFDLPGYGVYRLLSGASPASAQRLNPVDASLLSADAAGDLAVQFPNYGIFRLASGGNSFTRLTTNGAASALAIGGPAGDVFAEYPGSGVYLYTTASGAFAQITLSNAYMPGEDANGDVFAVVSGRGVYRNTLAGGWQQLNPVTPTLTAVDAAGDEAVDFPGYGVYLLKAGSSSFTQLTAAAAGNASLLAIDGNGDVFADLPTAGGIYEFPSSGAGKLLTPVNATVMTVDAKGDLFADFTGYGVQELKAGTTSFIQLNKVDASILVADANGDLAANFQGYGVFRLLNGAGPNGWQRLNTINASQLAIDGGGDVFVQFAGYNGVYRYTSPTTFSAITTANVSLLTDDLAGDVFVDFSGYEFYRYTPGNGFQLVMGTEGDASVLD